MKHKYETSLDYLDRLTYWLNQNPGSVTDNLTIPQLIELFELISDKYDVSLFEEIFEVIADGDKSEVEYNAFIDKYNMPWKKIINGKFES